MLMSSPALIVVRVGTPRKLVCEGARRGLGVFCMLK